MSKDELWQLYVRKNPGFLTDGASFTPDGLRKFFDQTWDVAHGRGIENGRALEKDAARKQARSSPMSELEKMFGGIGR